MLLCLLLLIQFYSAFGCGATTHNVICSRALSWWNRTDYKQLINKHLASFQNGAAFPDWGFALSGSPLHDVSEATHWPPFITKMGQHIYSNYPKPYSEEGQEMVSLLFGVYCHSVADIIWHDLHNIFVTYQGWIQSMADIEFQGNFGAAHTESDTGGDFYAAATYNLEFLNNGWYFPVFDMVQLYHSLNYTAVTYENIVEGNALLFAETQFMKRLAYELSWVEEQNSTFLQEQYLSFFFGGVDDMATWVTRCWDDVVDWLENGVTKDGPLCVIEPPLSSTRSSRRHFRTKLQQTSLWRKYGKQIRDSIKITKSETGEGVYITTKEPFPERAPTQHLLDEDNTAACLDIDGSPAMSSSLRVSMNYENSYFGTDITFGTWQGQSSVVISAPGYGLPGAPGLGSVFVFSGIQGATGHQVFNFTPTTKHANKIEQSSDAISILQLHGKESGANFGTSVAVVDLNKDGVDDLVVSAPHANSSSVDYRGMIYIYYGDKSTKNLPTEPSVTIFVPITPTKEQHLGDPSFSSGAWANIGMKLYSFDIDSDGFLDLVIGSYLSCELGSGSDTPLLRAFPNFQLVCDPQVNAQRGAVSIFLSSRWNPSTSSVSITTADWTQYGETRSDWFGYHVDFISYQKTKLLIVGAPNYQVGVISSGRLYAFNFDEFPRVQPKMLWAMQGTQKFDKVGSFSSCSGHYRTSYIAISLPSRNVTSAPQDYWQSGAVFMIQLSDIPAGTFPITNLMQFGTLFEGVNMFGHFGETTGWYTRPDNTLAFRISESYYSRERGRVYEWSGSDFPAMGTKLQVLPSTCSRCFEETRPSVQSRFGNKLLFKDF